jgi:hypothetical protein
MDEYSFLDHVNLQLGDFLNQRSFVFDKSSSQLSPGYEFNLLAFVSPGCQIRAFVEHYRIYIEISALHVKDPNLWYNIDAMACFVSGTSPKQWVYNLPRRVPLRQVMEQQLVRWHDILRTYFDQIVPLFRSKDELTELRNTLDPFVVNFYAERQKASIQ